MSLKPAKVQFNGGELSPWLDGRTDIAKYDKTAKLCRNFIPMAEGSLKRRGGTRFVAQTPEDDELKFKIVTMPEEAGVLINGVAQREIFVARGDKVFFEVSADGYSSQSGSMVIIKETEVKVWLVSKSRKATLTVETVPEDAEVKIEGIVRKTYDALLNKNVSYMVTKNGYVPQVGTVFMNEDKVISVTLLAEDGDEDGGVYGDWGVPQYFISCTAVGWMEKQKKCLLFRFTNGYLAVVFDANLQAPNSKAERVFFNETRDGFDSICYKKGKFYLSCLFADSDAYRYKDLNGKLIVGVDTALTMKLIGWQVDENGKYASFYKCYSGSVSGTVGRVYYDGNLIWKLVGDYNNG